MANKTGDYEADRQRLKEFLANFAVTDEDGKKTFKYAEQLTAIAHREQTSLTIDLEDVAGVDEDLATAIRENTRRYNLLVAEVVEALLPDYRTRDVPSRDALDVFIKHRQTATERAEATVAPGVQQPPAKVFPPELMRRFEVYFKTQASDKVLPIREVKAGQIGKLISIKGIVTRATEVKPMMQVATYTCDQCGAETFQPINSTSFMPQISCPGEDCRVNKSGGRLTLQSRGSKFSKFQELKVQEHSDAVPTGHIPRSFILL
jgi:DNA replication licensing factor MCM7